MFIVLNGPLGIGKSTLAEALTESINRCVMLNGDHLVASNPPPSNLLEYLHSTIAFLVTHHRHFGYRHFVIDHLWRTHEELADLRQRLLEIEPDAEFHCLLLTLPLEENLRRIERRGRARAIDEQEFEQETVRKERTLLFESNNGGLGEPFDVTAPPEELVSKILEQLRLDAFK